MNTKDKQIRDKVAKRLKLDISYTETNIMVEVAGGQVRFTGKVNSLLQKKGASLIAWSVPGVKKIDNRLEIFDVHKNDQINDDEIAKNVSTALRINSQTRELQIEISVENGFVTLSGSVDAFYKVRKLEDIVTELTGVRDVTNLLTVVPSQNITDEIIAQAISEVFEENDYIEQEKIYVIVNNGIVTLRGKVLSAKTVMEAYDCASRILGVINVNNEIVWG